MRSPIARLGHTFALLATLVLAGCDKRSSGGGSGPPIQPGSLNLKTVATITGGGAHMPVLVTAPPGDLTRAFVVDKYGIVRIIKADTLVARPFLDIHTLVTSAGTEQGLLGLAFSPNYATDHSFYVCYNNVPNWWVTVARYHVTADPDSADASSGQIIISQDHSSYSNHNGGMIAFGPDGYLYFSLGDGGSQNDPNGTGQNVDDWLASILRLDVSGGGPGYATPSDNPFPSAGHPAGKPELWCYGLRNPWRFSFDRQTGDLYIGDVGQDTYEEVDVATAASGGGKAVDFGWNVTEGDSCFSPSSGCSWTGIQHPAVAYEHDGTQNCVIGGYVYRGSAIPSLAGTYFYSDNLGRWLRSFRYSGGVATNSKDWGIELAPAGDGVNAFGQDGRGELYVCCTRGAVKRIVP